jgi:hypothetical protein
VSHGLLISSSSAFGRRPGKAVEAAASAALCTRPACASDPRRSLESCVQLAQQQQQQQQQLQRSLAQLLRRRSAGAHHSWRRFGPIVLADLISAIKLLSVRCACVCVLRVCVSVCLTAWLTVRLAGFWRHCADNGLGTVVDWAQRRQHDDDGQTLLEFVGRVEQRAGVETRRTANCSGCVGGTHIKTNTGRAKTTRKHTRRS